VLITPHSKNWHSYKIYTKSQAWADPLVQPKHWKRNVRFGTWNVRSLYRSGSLTIVARELARYELDLVCVQKLYFFSMEKE
jgi:hypothetical protein